MSMVQCNRQVTPECNSAIMGCSEYCSQLPYESQRALMFGLVIAYKKWLNDMIFHLYLEDIEYLMLLEFPCFLSCLYVSFA